MIHPLPEGGANLLPTDFKINSLLELREKMNIKKCTQITCSKHNDPLKVYCLTCSKVICRDCTFSEAHSKHQFELISEHYPRHLQQIQADLDLLKHKTADVNTAVTAIVTREREVVQQGEEIKEQIHRHAQQLINKVQRSEKHLLQQVDTLVRQKRNFLSKQREQAKGVHTQLKRCEENVKQSLNEWSQLQVMMEKKEMLYQMKIVGQNVDSTELYPVEKADIKFSKNDITEKEIGDIKSSIFGKAVFSSPSCSPNTPSTAILTLQSQDSSPFSLPPSLISCKLSSSGTNQAIKCHINQTQQGKYNISFTPRARGDQLIVQVGGVDISGSPFTLQMVPLQKMRGRPVKTINGLVKPHGIAVCDNGDIVVAENGSGCVTIVNKEGKKVRSFGTRGTKGHFTNLFGVAISIDGHILAVDSHRLQKLTFDGVCIKSVGSSKDGCGQLQFRYPEGIAVQPITGQIFVADGGNNRIQVFNNDLSFSRTITHGNQFSYPYDVSLDSVGHLYVAVWSNDCITKFTSTGQYITRFGSHGTTPGKLYRPSSLIVSNDLVYVSEACSHRVSIFDTKGKFLHCFGKEGSGEGELDYPHGITVDTFGFSLYVSDTRNNRVVIF